jgi:hypothetical protein
VRLILRSTNAIGNDDWQTQNRYTQMEGFVEPADKIADIKPLQITPRAA